MYHPEHIIFFKQNDLINTSASLYRITMQHQLRDIPQQANGKKHGGHPAGLNKILVSSAMRKIIILIFVCAGLAMGNPAAASIYRTSSSIVLDAESEQALYEHNADDLAYPASLTKVMTLMLLFDEINKGSLQPASMLTVSNYAAHRPKTRLGLRTGDKISVDLAIRSIVVLSANDAAVTIAENISGNEASFAKRMTQKAKEIGMSNTRFANASGLPNKAQVTTARDMALLGEYIISHYPQYYHYFSVDSFVFRNSFIRTHNHVLAQYEGADGFKTGFTSRAGYNLLTSAERGGRRVVAVVLGGSSPAERDNEMSFLLNRFIPLANTYSNSLALANYFTNNSQPQQSLKDAYKKYIAQKPPKITTAKQVALKQTPAPQIQIAQKRKINNHLLLASNSNRLKNEPTTTPATTVAQTPPKTTKMVANSNKSKAVKKRKSSNKKRNNTRQLAANR